MKRYHVSYRYSNDGKNWINATMTVYAESDMSGIMQVKSKYPYIQIFSVS
ncbi:MAG: hypothetical protein HDT23_07875 [Ruminococcus sp.]|nr:hypothetical protein [Ruminococcus sp.]